MGFRRMAGVAVATVALSVGLVSTASAVNYRSSYGQAFFGPTAMQDCHTTGDALFQRGQFDFYRCEQKTADWVQLTGYIITS